MFDTISLVCSHLKLPIYLGFLFSSLYCLVGQYWLIWWVSKPQVTMYIATNDHAHLTGIAVGHVYYFLEDVFPQKPGGFKIIKTPNFMYAYTDLYTHVGTLLTTILM